METLVKVNCWSCGVETQFWVDEAEGMQCDCCDQADDSSICTECASIGILTRDMKIRQPTTEEMEEFLKDENVVRTLLKVRQSIEERKGDQ